MAFDFFDCLMLNFGDQACSNVFKSVHTGLVAVKGKPRLTADNHFSNRPNRKRQTSKPEIGTQPHFHWSKFMLNHDNSSCLNDSSKSTVWLIAYILFKVKGQEIDGEIKHGAPVFIILTDGEARDKDKRKEEIIQKYRSMSRMQIAVGVGSSFNRDELERISN